MKKWDNRESVEQNEPDFGHGEKGDVSEPLEKAAALEPNDSSETVGVDVRRQDALERDDDEAEVPGFDEECGHQGTDSERNCMNKKGTGKRSIETDVLEVMEQKTPSDLVCGESRIGTIGGSDSRALTTGGLTPAGGEPDNAHDEITHEVPVSTNMEKERECPTVGESKNELRLRERIRLGAVFTLVAWPVSPLVAAVWWSLSWWRARKDRGRALCARKLLCLWLLQPAYVLTLGWRRRWFRVLLGVALLMPLLLTTAWSSYVTIWDWGGDVPFEKEALQSPSQYFPMGTDGVGRSDFQQIASGARNSYYSSLIAVVVALGLGVLLGRASDYVWLDAVLTNGYIELIETVPMLFILMVVFALFSDCSAALDSVAVKDMLRVVILGSALGVGFTPPVFRLVRQKILALKHEEFLNAAKAHGVSQGRIIWRHVIWKNSLTDLLLTSVQIWGFAILMEISLGYIFSIGASKLGGERYDSWTWLLLAPESKNALIGNVDNIAVNWWLWFFPVFYISATIIGFYVFGDGLKQLCSRSNGPRVIEDGSDYRFEALLMSTLWQDRGGTKRVST